MGTWGNLSFHAQLLGFKCHNCLWLCEDYCPAFHPRTITGKAGFQLEWYFLTHEKNQEQRFKLKKKVTGVKLGNTEGRAGKVHVPKATRDIARDANQRKAEAEQCHICLPAMQTQLRYPPTWIGAGKSPCSCSPGVYSSFSFFSWIRRLLGLWRMRHNQSITMGNIWHLEEMHLLFWSRHKWLEHQAIIEIKHTDS